MNVLLANNPFTVTPRQPYVAGRGWLNVFNVLASYPNDGNQGTITFQHMGGAQVHLANALGKRFLVDCTVKGSQVLAKTQSTTLQVNAPSGATLSIVTAPGEYFVDLDFVPDNSEWYLYGCEITRIQ